MSQLTAGALAPDFDVQAHDGSRVHLADLAGSYVLLWFYPEADTPG
jgi:peroxiredoxin Q/BCP